MRKLSALNSYRCRQSENRWAAMMGDVPNYGEHDDTGGVFFIKPKLTGPTFKCLAGSGLGWDHVSISLPNRCPTWEEMDKLKRLFFEDDETAFQLHLPPSDHISVHPFCLHIWRPHDQEIPLPPKGMVA